MYYADGTKMADGDNDDEIIVCQKDDGTYHYYYEKEFRREFKNGNLQFGNMDEAKDEYSLESTGEVIDSLINDWIESSASIYRNILDSERSTQSAGGMTEKKFPKTVHRWARRIFWKL